MGSPPPSHGKHSPILEPGGTVPRGFRSDIEGLRAVAVVLVLLYHAEVPLLAGGFVGVDVFFVISGFLITGLLLREIESRGSVDLRRFYARRVRRLLPASVVVLVATALLTFLIVPMIRWRDIAWDIGSSALYLANWRFARQSVDYLASDQALSPVLHFWSLAIEEQFYLVWPAFILLATWWHRRRGGTLSTPLVVALALVAVPSLWWSWHLSTAAPAEAYFVSTTRIWELALGGGLAIAAPHLRSGARWLAPAVSVLGLAAILWAALSYGPRTTFPGLAALVPTVGTALVIVGGTLRGGAGPVWQVLSIRPMQWTGSLSYSLYLWHWPLLAVALAHWGSLGGGRGLAIVALSFVPSWLTYRYVENPVRHMSSLTAVPGRAVGLAAGSTVVVVGAAMLLAGAVSTTQETGEVEILGAAVLLTDRPAASASGEVIVPDPLVARDDNSWVYERGCHQGPRRAEPISCVAGDTTADRTVAVVGDSHAAQWVPALDDIAADAGWRLESYTKSACGFADVRLVDGDGAVDESCTRWNETLLDELTGPDGPDVVVVSQSHTYDVDDGAGGRLTDDEAAEAHAAGLVASWTELLDAGVDVVVLRDTPRPRIDVPECVSENRDALERCAVPLDQAMRGNTEQMIALDEMDHDLPFIDMAPEICPDEMCAPVIGNVLVWRDTNHLTARYVDTLTPFLEDRLVPVLP